MSRTYSVAIIGASGAVGAQVLSLLEERGLPVQKLQVFRSEVEEIEGVTFNGNELSYERLCPPSLAGVDIAFFCAPAGVALTHAPEVGKLNGGVAIDVSEAFRQDPTVPLVLPELNLKELELAFRGPKRRIISLPSAPSAAAAIAIAPLMQENKLERALITTYQAASSAGKRGLDELHQQIVSILNARSAEESIFSPQVAFNVLPIVPPKSAADAEGYTPQERAISYELRRLLRAPNLSVSASAAIVPTFIGEAAAIHLDFAHEIDLEKIRATLRQAPSVLLTEELEEKQPPMPIHATGEDAILVGRLRKSGPRSLWMWVSYDNLRKGAALSAVQLAEICLRDHAGAFEEEAKRPPKTPENIIKH